MPTLTDLSYLRLVALADAPPEVAPYHGLILGLRAADLAELGSGPESPGTLAGIFGYTRPNEGAGEEGGLTISAEWVMAPPIPAPVVAAFEVLPGPEGWQIAASRTAYSGMGQALIVTYGIAAVDVLAALQSLYTAAVHEGIARAQAGYPLT